MRDECPGSLHCPEVSPKPASKLCSIETPNRRCAGKTKGSTGSPLLLKLTPELGNTKGQSDRGLFAGTVPRDRTVEQLVALKINLQKGWSLIDLPRDERL